MTSSSVNTFFAASAGVAACANRAAVRGHYGLPRTTGGDGVTGRCSEPGPERRWSRSSTRWRYRCSPWSTGPKSVPPPWPPLSSGCCSWSRRCCPGSGLRAECARAPWARRTSSSVWSPPSASRVMQASDLLAEPHVLATRHTLKDPGHRVLSDRNRPVLGTGVRQLSARTLWATSGRPPMVRDPSLGPWHGLGRLGVARASSGRSEPRHGCDGAWTPQIATSCVATWYVVSSRHATTRSTRATALERSSAVDFDQLGGRAQTRACARQGRRGVRRSRSRSRRALRCDHPPGRARVDRALTQRRPSPPVSDHRGRCFGAG